MKNPSHILITGASSGLGAALAEGYAREGILLSLQGRDKHRLDDVARKAETRGAKVSKHLLDVCDQEGMAVWIKARDAVSPLDLVIANAGISAGTGLGCESRAQADALWQTNFVGVLNTIDPVLPRMIARRRGQIGLMSSLAGFRGLTGAPSYAASKAAVRVYGEALRGEMAPLGVEINVICPGFIKTPMTDPNPFPMPFLMSPEKAAAIIQKGLYANKARIAFPRRMAALIHLVEALPQDWVNALLGSVPRKKPL